MKVLIFGGTSEGRRLSGLLAEQGHAVTLCVATDYGKQLAPADNRVAVISGRLDISGMTTLLKEGWFDVVLDTTHPYAQVVTENIRLACEGAKVKRLRLIRPETDNAEEGAVRVVPSVEAAAQCVASRDGGVLLTVGSKALEAFTSVANYEKRMFVRILPMADSLEKALNLGFSGPNIICMQGPFSFDMNVATLRMTGAKTLVTKDSGDTGGFLAKIAAARTAGALAVVIGRPAIESGYTFSELLDYLDISNKTSLIQEQPHFFPLFIHLKNKPVLIVGGGKIACGRVRKLMPYGVNITAVAPDVVPELKALANEQKIKWIKRPFEPGDISNFAPFLVIAATDNPGVNRAVGEAAKAFGALAVVSDDRSACDCYFPALAENETVLAGLVSKDGDHAGLKITAARIRSFLNEG